MARDWYDIATLFVNILASIGTVGAVICSVYFSRKKHDLIKVISIGGFIKNSAPLININLGEGREIRYNSGDSINITLSCDNYLDKEVTINRVQIFFLHEIFMDTKEAQILPHHARNAKIFLSESYKSNDERKKDILKIKNSIEAEIHLETNIGDFEQSFTKKQLKKLVKHLTEYPEILIMQNDND